MTIGIPATGPAQDGVHTQSFNGPASTTVSDVTITNLNPNLPSLGINNVVANDTAASTGAGSLTMSGVNNITTTNGGGTLVNVRGSGNATTTITGTLNVTVLTDNYNMNDGVETTTRGGAATLDMSQVDSAMINVSGGNGILIDSLTGAGNVTGDINSNVTVNLNNTNSGTSFDNAGIRAFTAGAGVIDLTTGATIDTQGPRAAGISTTTVAGSTTIDNSGAIETAGVASNGIQATTGSGAIAVTNSGDVTASQAVGVLTTATGAGTAAVTNTADGSIAGLTGVQFATTTPSTLQNAGTITGTNIGVLMPSGGSIANTAGSIASTSGVGVLASGGVTVDSTAAISGATNAVEFQAGTNALRLGAGSTTVGTVTMGTGSDTTTVLAGADISGVPLFNNGAGTSTLIFDGYVGDAPAISATAGSAWQLVQTTNGANVSLSGAQAHEALLFDVQAGSTLGFSTSTGDLVGDVANAGTLDYSAGGGAGAYGITGTLTNSGVVQLSSPVPAAGTRLTMTNLVGQGGVFALDTFLGADGSPSDQVVINGGSATGNSLLRIANAGGPGDVTEANGILVVDAIGGGVTAPGAFALESYVIAGPYEYTLFRGSRDASGPENWYLRSTLDCAAPGAPSPPCPAPPEPPPEPPPGPPPEPPPPHFRQEVSLYAPTPVLMANYGRQILDTLHERVGEEEQLRGRLPPGERDLGVKGVWGRALYWESDVEGDPLGIYGEGDGPAYDMRMGALQLGVDLYRRVGEGENGQEGPRDHVGLMGAFGEVEADVDHNLLQFRFPAGRIKMDNWSLGAYWTHFRPNGAYLDFVAQATFYDIDYVSRRLPPVGTDGFGVALSAEGGYPIRFDGDWQIEPQAQLIYQDLSLDSFEDPGAEVRFRDLDSLVGRIGVRVANVGLKQAWFRANIWHEFFDDPRTEEVSSADGFIPFGAALPETWWQVGVGGSAVVDEKVTVYGQGAYESDFDGDNHGWTLKLGARLNF